MRLWASKITMMPLQPKAAVPVFLSFPFWFQPGQWGQCALEKVKGVFVALENCQIMATASSHISCLYLSLPVPRISFTICLTLRNCLSSSHGCGYSSPQYNTHYHSLFRVSELVLVRGGRGNLWEVWGGSQLLCLYFSVWHIKQW